MNNKEKTKQDELTLIIEELISKPLDDLCLFESFVSIRLPPSCSLCSAPNMMFSLYSTWENSRVFNSL